MQADAKSKEQRKRVRVPCDYEGPRTVRFTALAVARCTPAAPCSQLQLAERGPTNIMFKLYNCSSGRHFYFCSRPVLLSCSLYGPCSLLCLAAMQSPTQSDCFSGAAFPVRLPSRSRTAASLRDAHRIAPRKGGVLA